MGQDFTSVKFNLVVDRNIYIDLHRLPDPIRYLFGIEIWNQSFVTLWFRFIQTNPNWSPSSVDLGSVAPGARGYFVVELSRPLPTADLTEDMPITIEAYLDSAYTQLATSISETVTCYLEYTENWPWVNIDNFDDGTWQGWAFTNVDRSRGEISTDHSVIAGGYSVKVLTPHRDVHSVVCAYPEAYIEKTLTVGTGTKGRLTLYFANKRIIDKFIAPHEITVHINDELKRILRHTNIIGVDHTAWRKITVAIPPGESVRVRITVKTHSQADGYFEFAWYIDHIVWAVS